MSDDVNLDFSDLSAVFINTTLKRSPAVSNTEGLMKISTSIMEQHGISVSWQSGSAGYGLEAEGRRPDVALIASTGLIASQAEQGHLIDMGPFVDTAWTRVGLDDYLFELAIQDEDRLYAFPWAVSVSSLVWYPLQEFEDAGYDIPQTWDELIVLSERMAADGRTPWCLGIDSSSSPGDVATDWVEDLVLHASGPEAYDRWVGHDLLFGDSAVRDAYERFGQVAYGRGFVLGDSVSINHIERDLAAWPMFTDRRLCWLHRDGSESRAAWPQASEVKLGAFRFPAIDPQYSNALTGHVYMITVLRDRPEVRTLVEYLLTGEVAIKLAVAPFVDGILPARDVDPWWYGDSSLGRLRKSEDLLLRTALRAGLFRVGASDLMPPQVGFAAFPQGLVTYLNLGKAEAARQLTQVLNETDGAWP